jgi:hypothetical protein
MLSREAGSWEAGSRDGAIAFGICGGHNRLIAMEVNRQEAKTPGFVDLSKVRHGISHELLGDLAPWRFNRPPGTGIWKSHPGQRAVDPDARQIRMKLL